MCSFHTKAKSWCLHLAYSSSLKSVFEKLRFRDGLAWTEGLIGEINLPVLNSSSVVYIGTKIDLALDGDPYLLQI